MDLEHKSICSSMKETGYRKSNFSYCGRIKKASDKGRKKKFKPESIIDSATLINGAQRLRRTVFLLIILKVLQWITHCHESLQQILNTSRSWKSGMSGFYSLFWYQKCNSCFLFLFFVFFFFLMVGKSRRRYYWLFWLLDSKVFCSNF